MANTRKSLGRGIAALIPNGDMDFFSRIARGEAVDTPVTETKPATRRGGARDIASAAAISTEATTREASTANSGASEPRISQIAEWIETTSIEANPYQPRRNFADEEMQELVASVREHGILQPILVRPLESSDTSKKFQLVAGERRWRAACAAGLKRVPAIVRTVSDQQSLELALIENVQRHDISALDAAVAYKRLADDFNLSQAAIADRVGKSRSAVANTLRLLDLPDEIRKALEDGLLTEGHGRAILSAPGEGSQRAIFRRILRDKLSVRDVERLARQATDTQSEGRERKQDVGVDQISSAQAGEYRKIALEMQKNLGSRVSLKPRAKGGQIVIRCLTQSDLERVTRLLSSI